MTAFTCKDGHFDICCVFNVKAQFRGKKNSVQNSRIKSIGFMCAVSQTELRNHLSDSAQI